MFRALVVASTRPLPRATTARSVSVLAQQRIHSNHSTPATVDLHSSFSSFPPPSSPLLQSQRAQQSRRTFATSNDEEVELRLSALSPARQKFFHILNTYRSQNYAQSLPSRFLKDIINATDRNHDGTITKTEFKKLLKNIGAEEEMTKEELKEIFEEVGVEMEVESSKGGMREQKVLLDDEIIERWGPLIKH